MDKLSPRAARHVGNMWIWNQCCDAIRKVCAASQSSTCPRELCAPKAYPIRLIVWQVMIGRRETRGCAVRFGRTEVPGKANGAGLTARQFEYCEYDVLLRFSRAEVQTGRPSRRAAKEGSWEVAAYEQNLRLIRKLRSDFTVLASGDEHLLASYMIGTAGSQVSLAAVVP